MAVFRVPSSRVPETSLVFTVILTNICQEGWKDSEISWPKLEPCRSALQELGVSHLGMWPWPEEACFQAQNNLNLPRGGTWRQERLTQYLPCARGLTWACPSLKHTMLEQVSVNRGRCGSQTGKPSGSYSSHSGLCSPAQAREGKWAKTESWEFSRRANLSLAKTNSAKCEAPRVWVLLNKILNQLKLLFHDVERKSLPFQGCSFLLNVSLSKLTYII